MKWTSRKLSDMRRIARWAIPLATAALAAAGVVAPAGASGHAHIRYENHHPLPDRHVTPGRSFAHATPAKFCHAGYTAKVRSVSDSTRQAVFAEYGISYAQHSHYEVDHLVPLELGGSNSIQNLWPERGSIPNAKDGVENELHNLVCENKLKTAPARHAIATDWVKALHTYGHTGYVYERPAKKTSGGSKKTGGGSHSCTKTSSGSCIRGGEFCPAADYGQTGYDANGTAWTCEGDRSHPHWE